MIATPLTRDGASDAAIRRRAAMADRIDRMDAATARCLLKRAMVVTASDADSLTAWERHIPSAKEN